MLTPIPTNLEQKLRSPEETRIRGILEKELFSSEWSREVINRAKKLQFDFFRFSLDNNDSNLIRQKHNRLLRELANISNTVIASGLEKLDSSLLGPNKSIIVVINHLGIGKGASLDPTELGLPADQLGLDEPFSLRYASLSVVADKMGRPLFETAGEQPAPLDKIQNALGTITTSYGQSGGIQQLEKKVEIVVEKNPNALMIMYPEGGTSGKWNNGNSAYDLGEFKTGAFVVAGHLSLPVLPICQYFDPKSKQFKLGILEPIKVENSNNRDYFKQLATSTKQQMQDWLNSQKS